MELPKLKNEWLDLGGKEQTGGTGWKVVEEEGDRG